jgi:hypothetical protein
LYGDCDADEQADPCVWTRAELASCELIGTAREGETPGVYLVDFHAG